MMTRDWQSCTHRALAAFRSLRSPIKLLSKSSLRFVATGVALFFSAWLQAGASEGLVKNPLVNEANVFMFSAGTHQNAPACATQTLATWAISLNNPAGQNMMSLVLTAHAQGKRLHVQGTNYCNSWGDREQPLYAFIVD